MAAMVWLLAACGGGLPPSPATASASPSVPLSSSGASWDQVVQAARGEGQVVVLGPPGSDVKEGLTAAFERAYPGVRVEYSGMTGSQLTPKLLNERQAAQYRSDVYISGTTTVIEDLIPAHAVQPIKPFLVGPDDSDPGKWLGGKFDFADASGEHNLVFTALVKAPFAYNPGLLTAEEIKTYKALLDPKWKGKLAMRDPRAAGPGLATVTFFYVAPGLGKDFVSQLLSSGLVLSNDDRQLMDWVARGQYAVAIAPEETTATEMKKKGITTLELFDPARIQEGAYLTAGFGSLAVIDRAPHPNAAKLYLNFLLSREGQLEWSKASGYFSRRLDVGSDYVLNKASIPKEGATYLETYKEQYVRTKAEVDSFLRSILLK